MCQAGMWRAYFTMCRKECSTDFRIDLVAHHIKKLYFCKLFPNTYDVDHSLNIIQGFACNGQPVELHPGPRNQHLKPLL